VGTVLIVALWWIAFPNRARSILRLAPLGLLALAVLQIALEGLYWQFIPAYFLIAVFDLLSIFSRGAPAGALAVFGRIGLVALTLAAIGPFLFMLPTPTLPKPSGPYAVGTEIFRWVDEAREETATGDRADNRNVIVQAWYPAAPGTHGRHSIYMDGLDDLPDMISLLPGFLLRSYGRIDTHAVEHALIAQDQPQWPVVLFSPGYGAPRAFYTSLVADLASRGYVVLALDHPYESAVTQLADGRIVADARLFPGEDQAQAWMASQLDIRVADEQFALDQLDRPGALGALSGHLDPQHVAAIGHSFGGAAAVAIMARDPRIKAAANVDGALYGPAIEASLPHPFLLIQSDSAEGAHGEEAFVSAHRRIFSNLAAEGWHYEIARSNHFSFTDAELFFAPPARLALPLAIGGARGAIETHRLTADLLDAFLSEPLGRPPASIEATAAKYTGLASRATE
jgi:predicted dienelactone hydrolase